jgi:hypothetical protein
MITDKKLDFYIENGMNVLFIGRHGVGKTAMGKAAFERHNLKWKYFSAATMDPWVDFVGVPKETIDKETGDNYIELVRPKGFHNDEVEAIFMDELNRAKDKVRNAVMELIQFRSINGVRFTKLKMIWAAINPEDEEDEDLKYDVERLDPAQKDRFHVHIYVPYEPSKKYFKRTFGTSGIGAVEWWDGLTNEQNKLVSPRRLEYAINFHQKGGDLRDIMPNDELNLDQLRQRLVGGSIKLKLKELFDDDDDTKASETFNNINFTTDAIQLILEDTKYIERFMKYVPKDMISKLITDNDGEHIEKVIGYTEAEVIVPILSSLIASNSLRRTVLQKVTVCADNRGLDLTSENAFNTAIKEGLENITKTRPDRYNALHGVSQNFNKSATLEVYTQALYFVTQMIYHTQDGSLNDENKPFNQIGRHILEELKDSMKSKHNTSVMDIWKTLKDKYPDKTRSARIESFLKKFLK